MDWKKILNSIVEHFLTKLVGVILISALSALGATWLADTAAPSREKRMEDRVALIMYYLEEILPDSAKARAEQKMKADKDKLGIE